MKLQVGKMRSEEIANFFEYSYSWYRKKENKEKALKKLKDYAEYEKIYGGVLITKVIKEEFLPEELNLEELFLEELKKLPKSIYYENEVYGSLIQMARDTIDEINEIRRQHLWKPWTESTLADKYGSISKQFFGAIKLNQKAFHNGRYGTLQLVQAKGPMGFRLSCMLIKTDVGGYRELTKNEQELFKETFEEIKKKRKEEDEQLEYCEAAYEKYYGDKQDGEALLEVYERKSADLFKEVREAFILKTSLTLVSKGTTWREDTTEIKLVF